MASSLFYSCNTASLPFYSTIKATTLQSSSSSARVLRTTTSTNFSPHLPPLPTYYASRYNHDLLLDTARSSNSYDPSTSVEIEKEENEVDYTSMRDHPLGFWEDSSNKLRTDDINELSSSSWWDSLLEAQIRLVENAARDRAAMRSLLMAQRDNWNHLLQRSVTFFLMTATVLAAISGSLSMGLSLSLNLPAALLNAGTALIMCVMSHFQPSQLAEEQRTASLLFSRLANDIDFTLSLSLELRPEGRSFLEDCRERMYALDAAYPMPLAPEGLEKFPKEVKSPVWNLLSTNYSSTQQPNDDEWKKDMLRTAALLRSSDELFYIGWAKRMESINKALGIMGPLLAMAGVVLNVVGMGSGAALCSVCAGLISTFSHDAQLGMIFEMFRNNAGYYGNIAHSIDRSIRVESKLKSKSMGEDVNVEKRKRLIKEKVAYQLGRRLQNDYSPIVPAKEERAGLLF